MEISIGAAIFGITAALVIMWLSLRKYTGFYSDKTLFKSLILGFILGFIAFLVESFSYGVGILFLILFPFVEQSVKFVGINLPSYHGKRDTIIYGFVMGLGFGSIFAPLLIVVASKVLTSGYISIISSLLLGIGYILFHGSTGCLLGYGIYKGDEKWKYFIYSTALGFPLPAVEVFDILFSDIYSVIIARMVEMVYIVLIFIMVYRKILPFSVPKGRRKDLNLV